MAVTNPVTLEVFIVPEKRKPTSGPGALISIAIPVRNEEENVQNLCGGIYETMKNIGVNYEIIFIPGITYFF